MEYLKRFYHGNKQQAEVETEENEGSDDEAEIQKKNLKDLWRNANMLKHVAPLPVIAEAITWDTPDALLPMTKMDPKTFCMPSLNSVAQKWFDSTSSTVISFESKKYYDDDDPEEGR